MPARQTGTYDEVIAAWREGKTLRTVRDGTYIRMSTDGVTLYSYEQAIGTSRGEHNEIKEIDEDAGWSRTTSRHIRLAKEQLGLR